MRILPQSSCQFIYPFEFNRKEYRRRFLAYENNVADWQAIQVDKSQLVNGVVEYEEVDESVSRSDYASWKMTHSSFKEWSGLVPAWKVVRNRGRDSEQQLPFKFIEARVSLFNTGHGLLTLACAPLSKESKKPSNSFDDWLDFLHYFRFSEGQRNVSFRGNRKILSDSKKSSEFQEFEFDGPLQLRLDLLLLSNEDASRWWSDTFVKGQLFPFYCLLAEDCEDGSDAAFSELYRLRNLFHARSDMLPSRTDLSPEHDGIREYADNQWFVFSLEGGGFWGRNPPESEFFHNTLPRRISDQYWFLLQLVLHQRFHIASSLRELARQWERNESRNEDEFRRLKELDIWYSSRFQFGQVAQNDHHQNFYEKWQKQLRVDKLLAETKEKLTESHQHASAQRSQKIENRIEMFGALIGLPALVATIMSVSVAGWNSNLGWEPRNFVLVILGSVLIGASWFFLLLRR